MPTATLNEQPVSKTQAAQDEADIRALIESVNRAHYTKDGATLVAPYTADAAIFSLAPPLAHRGMDLREKQAWLDSWDGPIECEARDFQIAVRGDAAFSHGYLWLGGRPKAAGRTIGFWMRATVCLLREEGAWRIVHEHTSVPFYMDGNPRPAFDLEP
ncbi:MAG: nuclear transport factor 2 family protein [Bryobacteraceae bacterium]|jgi:ketosteroid isomerase-like protein